MKVKSVFGTGGPILDGGKGGRLLQKKNDNNGMVGKFCHAMDRQLPLLVRDQQFNFLGREDRARTFIFLKTKIR